jgi:protein FAM50
MANDAGEAARIPKLAKEREDAKALLAKRKEVMQQQGSGVSVGTIGDKFGGSAQDVYEAQFRNATVGLVTAEEFARKRRMMEEDVAASEKDGKDGKKKKKKKKKDVLSFDMDDEGDDDADLLSPTTGKPKFGKNPNVDTSFLPDQEREEADRLQREKLASDYKAEQDRIKKEEIEITYSYWDGSGHRKTIVVKKGDTIAQFLEKCRMNCVPDFPELRGSSCETMMYIKEDLIIPQSHTFYDLIVSKARGKSGPLFHFDVHDDVRASGDARIEKDESHAGKVMKRGWYDRNKHEFPASRWEVYDSAVVYDSYTISDGPKNPKK